MNRYLLIVLITVVVFNAVGATVRYQHTDMLGSIISESDLAGNIISRSHYEPFGKRIGGDKEGIGYTGHLHDKDLNLTYMQARYYDPVIGRFYSNDPVGTLGHFSQGNIHGFNRYAYANNNPYKYTDPDGKFAILAPLVPPTLTAFGEALGFVGTAAVAGYAGSEALNAYNESSDGNVIIDDKIKDQLGDRGWTEDEVNDLVGNTEPTGESTDNRRPNKTPDGKGRNDPASVYGSKDGGHVVVNDNTNEVTHVSDKNDPNWIPDSRIKWKEDN